MTSRFMLALLTIVSACAGTFGIEAAELKAMCAVGLKAVCSDIVPLFENATGHKVLMDIAPAAAH